MAEQNGKITNPETSILIVDDNPQYTMVLKKILTAAFGYLNITSVDSTVKAYDILKTDPGRFQLLFIDYNFPDGHTGGELLTRLATEELLGDKVAFLITSEPTVDNTKAALKAGARGVVAKPFDRKDLLKQLEKADRAAYIDSLDSF